MSVVFGALMLSLTACATPGATIAGGPANEQIATFDARVESGEAIVAEIGAMSARDRLLREAIIDGFRTITTGEERQAYIEGTRHHFDRIDGETTARLRQIFARMSWRELNAISPAAAEQTFSLISHSDDTEFKREMAAQFEPLARDGTIRGEQYANLIDDIALSENRGQVYGMNFECHHGVYQAKPVEDPANLNARRASIHLNSIEDYSAQMRTMYGECPADYSGN